HRSNIQRVFHQGTDPELDSYGGFFDNGHRKSTGLAEFLSEREVKDVYLAGLATDYCVKFSALDARQLGWNAHVIEDACRGVELKSSDVSAAIEEMKRAGVKMINSREIAR